MLHLFPTRLLLTVFAVISISAYALSSRFGLIANGTWLDLALGILKVATPAALASILLALILWRWTPGFVQNLVFPYLGGIWAGEIEFTSGGSAQKRVAVLEVEHTLTSIRFALSTEESTSETLVVHAQKVAVLTDLAKLVYIYEVVRREGFPGAGDRYRGCAFIDVKLNNPRSMVGSYMASANRSGEIRMTLQTPTEWWKLWR